MLIFDFLIRLAAKENWEFFALKSLRWNLRIDAVVLVTAKKAS